MRFKEFEGEWCLNKLGNIFSISVGGDIDKENVSEVKSEIFQYPIYANAEKEKGLYGYSNIYRVEGNVVTIAGRGVNFGIAHARNNKFYPIVRLLVLQPKKGENIYFFEYQINRLSLYKESTGVPQLTAPQVSAYKVFSPSLPEQNRIASFLTLIDERISTQRKIIEQQETLIKGLREKLFSQQLRFKNDNGKEFPKWEKKKLGEIGETYNGLVGKTKESFGAGKAYIQYMQIFEDAKIDISKFGLVEVGEYESQNKALFGDVFFTTSSETSIDIGTASVLLDEVNELYLNSFCFGFRAHSFKTLSPYFARYLFRCKYFRNDIVKLAQGSTRYNMSKVQLLKLNVLLPSIEEQTKISNFLSAIDKKINAEKLLLQQLEIQKRFLLQNLFI